MTSEGPTPQSNRKAMMYLILAAAVLSIPVIIGIIVNR